MAKKRFYIGKKDSEDYAGNLEEWITSKVPLPPPTGTRCEAEGCDGDLDHYDDDGDALRPLASSFVYRIEGGHICFTYVCEECGERVNEAYLVENEYPTTSAGYAVTPRYCT